MTQPPSPAPEPPGGRLVLSPAGTWRGVRTLLPVAIFVIPFGIAFGVAASERGLPVIQSIAMSALVFSGAAQFPTLEFWQDPIAFASLALVVLAVNARHVVMGAALSPWINTLPPRHRVLLLSLLSDPNFASGQMALRAGERDLGVLLGGGLILWVNWIAGTAIGALAGRLIGAPATYGLDVVMTCFLAAMVAGQIERRTKILPVLVAALVAVVLLDHVPTGWNVILGALAGGIAGGACAMPGDLAAWAAILLVAAITLGSRLAGAFLMSRVRMSPAVEHFLDNLSISVIAALVASLVARGGLREAVAVALASLVMLRWKSAVWAITAGMVIAAAWSFALNA